MKAFALAGLLILSSCTMTDQLAKRCEKASTVRDAAASAVALAETAVATGCTLVNLPTICSTAENGLLAARGVLQAAEAARQLVCTREL